MTVGGGLYQFGPFRLDPEVGILYRGTEPTMLGQRAVALLRRLLDNAGVPVSKDALVAAGWGGLAAPDNNLTVQIAALRRVLAQAAVSYFAELDEPHGTHDLALELSRSLGRAIPAQANANVRHITFEPIQPW